MNRRHSDQLGLDHKVISITVAMLTCYFVMERYAKRMQLSSNDFCRECKFAEEDDSGIHFLCQYLSLAKCSYGLFGLSDVVSCIDVWEYLCFSNFRAGFSAQ